MIQLRTLGGLSLTGDAGVELHSVLAQPKRLALLVYLALAVPGQMQRRDTLLALFWPESDEERARAALRTSLTFLRRSLGEGVIERRGTDEVGLAPGSVWCDALALAEAVQAGQWVEALDLYDGPLLPGFAVEDAPQWEEWLEGERERLSRLHARALQALAEEREVAADPAAAAELWRRLAAHDPFSARVALRLMGALEAAGERAAAIQHAAVHAEALREQLGAEPDPQVLALAEVLRTTPAAVAAPALTSPTGTPAASAASASATPVLAPLPVPPTPLLGREAELTAILGTLMRESVRLVTLTGPGGIGKTRLALATAREAREHFADGAVFVDLAPLADPVLVLPAIAEALDVQESGALTLHQALREHLAQRALLLVLDNFEHLLEAAIELPALLAAVPRLKLLATSREPLHLRGEHEHPVPPLARYAATELFAARARAVLPYFEITERNDAAVAAICARLDGLPLAIELAAARIKLFPPAQLLSRLESSLALLTGGPRDLPERHQTLRAAIRWSEELLCEAERRLFRRLAVFVGGFTLEAAEAVCGEGAAVEVLEGLGSLLDKSLLLRLEGAEGEPRFGMLETIQEYARERLEESGEAEALRRRHASYYCALAERAEPELRGGTATEWPQRLDEEHENLRAALRRSLRQGDVEVAARTAAALGWYWRTRGHLTEGRQWLREVLAAGGVVPPLVRARTLHAAGSLAWRQADYAAARRFAEESVALYRAAGEREALASVLNLLGTALAQEGDLPAAEPLFQEVLALRRAQGNARGTAIALGNLGEIARYRGDYARATALYEETLVLAGASGHPLQIANVLSNLGLVARDSGDPRRAGAIFRKSLRLVGEAGYPFDIAWEMAALAGVAAAEGQPERAARLFGAAEALFARLGAHLEPTDRTWYDRDLAAARAQLDDAAWQRSWEEGQTMTLEEAISHALEE